MTVFQHHSFPAEQTQIEDSAFQRSQHQEVDAYLFETADRCWRVWPNNETGIFENAKNDPQRQIIIQVSSPCYVRILPPPALPHDLSQIRDMLHHLDVVRSLNNSMENHGNPWILLKTTWKNLDVAGLWFLHVPSITCKYWPEILMLTHSV